MYNDIKKSFLLVKYKIYIIETWKNNWSRTAFWARAFLILSSSAAFASSFRTRAMFSFVRTCHLKEYKNNQFQDANKYKMQMQMQEGVRLTFSSVRYSLSAKNNLSIQQIQTSSSSSISISSSCSSSSVSLWISDPLWWTTVPQFIRIFFSLKHLKVRILREKEFSPLCLDCQAVKLIAPI